MEDRRAAERYPAKVEAVVLSPRMFARVLIRDLSVTGARIECLRSANLPETFRLRIPNCEVLQARLVWEDGTSAGICFGKSMRESAVVNLALGTQAAIMHHTPGWA